MNRAQNSQTMGDIDERIGRGGSQPRFLPMDQQPVNDPISKLIFDYERSKRVSDRDLVELIRKVERNNPERISKAPKFICQHLTHKSESVRKSAFTTCLAILNQPYSPRQMMLDAYRLSLCSSNFKIMQDALSFLPQFVDTCPEEANNLIKFGSIAYKRLPAPSTDVEMYLSKAFTKAIQ
uniref:Adaptin_N domain-containing protein n=1 Tax=Caenorhabditis tropicalis TaxID=1561998 RepID=A0A1I7T184_9PELO